MKRSNLRPAVILLCSAVFIASCSSFLLASCSGAAKQNDNSLDTAKSAEEEQATITDPFDYSIFGVPLIKQPSDNTCWAAVVTMMLSKKTGRTLSIEAALSEFGPSYVDIYKKDLSCNCRGLKPLEANKLFPAMGLTILPPQSPTIKYWFDLLKNNESPLFIVVGQKGDNPYYHAIVVTGFAGKGQADNTSITYIDPMAGKEYTKTMADFIKWYEGGSNWPGKGQILYYKK